MEKKIKIELPSVPNYIKVGEVLLDVAEFDVNELKQIGQEWTEKLIEVASRRSSL